MKKVITSSIVASFLLTSNAFAFFGGSTVNGATETTQIMNNIQLASQYMKQVQQYQTQLEQKIADYTSMKSLTQNIGKLDPVMWNKFSKDFAAVQDIVKTTQGMTYAAKDWQQKFENMHSGYDSLLNRKNLDPSAIYRSLGESTRQTVKDNMKRLEMTQKEWEDDDATMQRLQELSHSKTGQLQAIQAASEIALHQTQTLKKLQQTMMMSANTQNQWMMAEQSKIDVSKAFKDKFSTKNKVYEKGTSMYRELGAK